MISPPIMVLALPALGFAGFGVCARPGAGRRQAQHRAGCRKSQRACRAPCPRVERGPLCRRRRCARAQWGTALAAAEVRADLLPGRSAMVGLAWFAGTWGMFEALSLFWQRISYLYYMVIVMPGIYLAVAALLVGMRRWRWFVRVWIALVLIAAVVMYPFVPINW